MARTDSTEARNGCWALVNCIISQQLLQAAPHMQQTLSQLIDFMNSGLIHTLLNDTSNDIIHQLKVWLVRWPHVMALQNLEWCVV